MFDQPNDFRDESEALYEILASIDDADFARKTQFKGWTIDDVIGHLHAWNWAADASLNNVAGFDAMTRDLGAAMRAGLSLLEFEREWRDGTSGHVLLEQWRDFYRPMARRFADADPKLRVKWVGPDMSVRSSITARMMETWAHGQAVYDLLGIERCDTDRIKNVAILTVNTFGWSFANRKLPIPETPPYIRLTAPSGDIWEWNDPSADSLVEGSATEFCQVAAQVRSLRDTHLNIVGETAVQWMSIAQCFAGPPEQPPAPGTRFVGVGLTGSQT